MQHAARRRLWSQSRQGRESPQPPGSWESFGKLHGMVQSRDWSISQSRCLRCQLNQLIGVPVAPREPGPNQPPDREVAPEAHDPVQQDGRHRDGGGTAEGDERDDEAAFDHAEAAGCNRQVRCQFAWFPRRGEARAEGTPAPTAR